MKKLLEAGAASQSEMEQAQAALSTTEAQLKAAEAQTRQQSVALVYHTVTAPTAGVVGDIPVRVGDSVARSTVLTTSTRTPASRSTSTCPSRRPRT